jgi:hypothetical protein
MNNIFRTALMSTMIVAASSELAGAQSIGISWQCQTLDHTFGPFTDREKTVVQGAENLGTNWLVTGGGCEIQTTPQPQSGIRIIQSKPHPTVKGWVCSVVRDPDPPTQPYYVAAYARFCRAIISLISVPTAEGGTSVSAPVPSDDAAGPVKK